MKIVVDVNIWVSFGIGKGLADLSRMVQHPEVELFACDALLAELLRVVQYPKLEKYLPAGRVAQLLELLQRFATFVSVAQTSANFTDPKDNYLLDLCDAVQADYLVTGDKLLLELSQHHQTTIIGYRDFCQRLRPFA